MATTREFAVVAIAGYKKVGWVFDGSNRDYPDDSQLCTFDEAAARARKWCSIADTVGGDAKVIHVPTWKEVFWYGPCKGKIKGVVVLEGR